MITCSWCGRQFEPSPKAHQQAYCSKTCQRAAYSHRREERREERKNRINKLDKALDNARANGQSYAEYQKQRTIDLVRKGEL